MSLSIEIVNAHNGKLEYEILKKGTRVIIELPIYELFSLDVD